MIRGTTRLVGVFGYPVKHSASPPMHNAAFAALGLDWAYVPFGVAPERVGEAIAGVCALNLAGVNVTVPLKERIAEHLDEVSERARIIGSVNTVVNEDGRLRGDSTDGPGFLAALSHAGITSVAGRTILVLGAGGSARAVVYALADAGARVLVANRSVERAQALADEFAFLAGPIEAMPLTEEAIGVALRDGGVSVLVNTTSMGMHPHEDEMPPVPEDALTPEVFVSDLIYNPAETRLLALARSRGCRIQNGVEMLVRQGALSFQMWTGAQPPVDVMREAVLRIIGIHDA